ncbi:uncharacterized protein LOC116424882 [Nomia melanderi]|uniref:uncharacterized protein LOC116424882 n=1 Tax=Nomia melanderi TaxID=2448451 RepID=UPI003FCECA69
MVTLRRTFSLLTYLGCLSPPSWTSVSKRILYRAHSLLIAILLLSLVLSSLLDIVLEVENQNDFSDNFYLTTAMMVGNYKMFNFHTKREAIMVLINNMRKRPFSAEDQAEKNIMTKYRKMIENKSTAYIVVIEIYLIVMWTTSLCRDPKERRLPIRGWIPYDYSTPILYGVTYCYQVLSTVSATFMHVANDILFSNLMLLIHCQLEILEYRLRQIKNDDKGSARECARYHEYIYEFAAEVNKIFQGVLCFQFLASVGMICFNLYRITQTELGPRVYETCLYTVITLLQLFYYSWYGNEVRLKSLELPEMIIRSNWTNLDNETRKILLVIMLRATLPIEFTSAHVLSVNVETFMTVLKTSYSAYNVMQSLRIGRETRREEADCAKGVEKIPIVTGSQCHVSLCRVESSDCREVLSFSKIDTVTRRSSCSRPCDVNFGNFIMLTLRVTFIVLKVLGCQGPVTLSSTAKKLYKVYTVVVSSILLYLLLTIVLDLLLNVKNQEDLCGNFYALVPVVTSSCKLCSFLANRERIMALLTKVNRKPHLPTNETEMKIEIRFNRMNEKLTRLYTSVFLMCTLVIWISSLIRDTRIRVLAFRAWIPYNYSSASLYTVTYVHQVLSVTISTQMDVAYDTLFSGLMFCINSQLEILGHRLRNIRSDQRGTARECARHLNYIYDFVAKMNERFELVLCVQFLTSALSMCFVLYQFTQSDGNARLAEMFMYAVCMLVEIFYYCWYGNEVRLKSLEIPDVIYASDWLNLDEKTKKTLLMIMIRSRIPMQFTSAHVVSMNIDTFMTVLKTSYSAYNVLQQR